MGNSNEEHNYMLVESLVKTLKADSQAQSIKDTLGFLKKLISDLGEVVASNEAELVKLRIAVSKDETIIGIKSDGILNLEARNKKLTDLYAEGMEILVEKTAKLVELSLKGEFMGDPPKEENDEEKES